MKEIKFANRATRVVYLVPVGFPENTHIEKVISIPSYLENNLHIAFVDKVDDDYTTTKKRSFVIVGTGEIIFETRKNVYNLIPENFEGI